MSILKDCNKWCLALVGIMAGLVSILLFVFYSHTTKSVPEIEESVAIEQHLDSADELAGKLVDE